VANATELSARWLDASRRRSLRASCNSLRHPSGSSSSAEREPSFEREPPFCPPQSAAVVHLGHRVAVEEHRCICGRCRTSMLSRARRRSRGHRHRHFRRVMPDLFGMTFLRAGASSAVGMSPRTSGPRYIVRCGLRGFCATSSCGHLRRCTGSSGSSRSLGAGFEQRDLSAAGYWIAGTCARSGLRARVSGPLPPSLRCEIAMAQSTEKKRRISSTSRATCSWKGMTRSSKRVISGTGQRQRSAPPSRSASRMMT
jgi:hypothetical protein